MLRRFFIVLYLLTGSLAGMAVFAFFADNVSGQESVLFLFFAPLIGVVLIHFIVGFDA